MKDVYKAFNLAGDALVERLRAFREHDIHVLGSFIFGLPTDSARVARSTRSARLGLITRRLFLTTPMPHLQAPEPRPAAPVTLLTIGRR